MAAESGTLMPAAASAAGKRRAVSLFSRDELTWDKMAEAGEAFLVERARLARLTFYTELNATLIRRTGLPGFDFSR
jgi:hypothetical protein